MQEKQMNRTKETVKQQSKPKECLSDIAFPFPNASKIPKPEHYGKTEET